jgi:solute carrier family 25 carnitine/acylcarnitine transporter 20/29
MSADFWAGYVSGAAGIIIGNPLDLIKTRLQAGKHTQHAEATSTSVATPQGFRGNFENAGTLVRGEQRSPKFREYLKVWKGVKDWRYFSSIGATVPILTYGALNALLFVTYNRTLALLHPSPQDPTIPYTATDLSKIFLAGATGGLASFVVSAPTELIKCRAQVSTSSNTTSWTIVRDVWRKEGIRGLYYGGGITSLRDAVGYGF